MIYINLYEKIGLQIMPTTQLIALLTKIIQN